MGLWALVGLLLFAVAVIFLIGIWWPSRMAGVWVRSIGGVFGLQILYLALLGVLLMIYATDPQSLPVPKVIAGVPIGVPWFGALGAITISLTALSEHRHDWDPEWWYWHASRPLVGAVAGSVTVLVFIAGILTVEQNAQATTSTATTKFLYYVVAFVIGYREASFRELLKALVDLLLKPAGSGQPTSITGRDPAQGKAGDPVTIFGTGLGRVSSISFDSKDARIKSAADSTIIVEAPAHDPGAAPIVVRTSDATFGGYTFNYIAPSPSNGSGDNKAADIAVPIQPAKPDKKSLMDDSGLMPEGQTPEQPPAMGATPPREGSTSSGSLDSVAGEE